MAFQKTFSLLRSEVSTSHMRGQDNATLNKGRANLAKPHFCRVRRATIRRGGASEDGSHYVAPESYHELR